MCTIDRAAWVGSGCISNSAFQFFSRQLLSAIPIIERLLIRLQSHHQPEYPPVTSRDVLACPEPRASSRHRPKAQTRSAAGGIQAASAPCPPVLPSPCPHPLSSTRALIRRRLRLLGWGGVGVVVGGYDADPKTLARDPARTTTGNPAWRRRADPPPRQSRTVG